MITVTDPDGNILRIVAAPDHLPLTITTDLTLREALTRATVSSTRRPICAPAPPAMPRFCCATRWESPMRTARRPERELTPAQQAAFDALIQRRLANEPIQYLTGEQEFYVLRCVSRPRPHPAPRDRAACRSSHQRR